MIVLGIVLLLIGYFTSLSILYTIGAILVVVGVVLWILGAVRPSGRWAKSLVLARFYPNTASAADLASAALAVCTTACARGAATLQRDSGQRGAHARHRGRGRRQRRHAHPHQHAGQQRVRGRLTAHPDRLADGRARAGGQLHQRQHRRAATGRSAWPVRPTSGRRPSCTGPDRWCRSTRSRHARGCGWPAVPRRESRSSHRASGRRNVPLRQRVLRFIGGGDHRRHHPGIAAGGLCRRGDRFELAGQQSRVAERDAHAAHPQRAVGLIRHGRRTSAACPSPRPACG